MAKIAEYTFSNDAQQSHAADTTGGRDATYHGDAASDGYGQAQFDGSGDYAEIPADSAFDLNQGTIAMTFTQTAPSTGDVPYGSNPAQTLFSVDASGYGEGGHLTIYITSTGEIGIRHQTENSSHVYSGGSVNVGEPVEMSYSFGPNGSVLEVNGVTVDTGTTAHTMAGGDQPITFGATQAHSTDGNADKLTGFFQGSIDRVEINDTPLNSPAPACFCAGTMIRVPDGARAVETLAVGDLILTHDHGAQPICRIETRHYSAKHVAATPKLQPIRVRAGALGNTDTLRVSRQHAVLMHAAGADVLVRAAHLEKFIGGAFTREVASEDVLYIHIELAWHSLIYANDTLVETRRPYDPKTGDMLRACRPILHGPDVRELTAKRMLAAPHITA